MMVRRGFSSARSQALSGVSQEPSSSGESRCDPFGISAIRAENAIDLYAYHVMESCGRFLTGQPAPELDDARRRYYRFTAFGRRVLDAECDRRQELVRAIRVKQAMVTE